MRTLAFTFATVSLVIVACAAPAVPEATAPAAPASAMPVAPDVAPVAADAAASDAGGIAEDATVSSDAAPRDAAPERVHRRGGLMIEPKSRCKVDDDCTVTTDSDDCCEGCPLFPHPVAKEHARARDARCKRTKCRDVQGPSCIGQSTAGRQAVCHEGHCGMYLE